MKDHIVRELLAIEFNELYLYPEYLDIKNSDIWEILEQLWAIRENLA